MKINPLVTVIIPNYNHEKFLNERIESVLCQTFQDFEIILFDDASTDNSLDVLNQFKEHSKVSHFIVNETNSGSPFKQWKKGLSLAKGKYIWIAETDDFAESTFLESTVKQLNKNTKLVFAYSDSTIIDSQGNILGKFSADKNNFFKTQKWSATYITSGIDEVLDFLLYKVTINNVSAVLFNKLFFEKLDFKKLEQFKNAGDLFTYISLCLQGDVCYVPLPLNNYREHEKNITKLNVVNGIIYKERLDCFNFVLDHLREHNLSIKENKRIKKALYFFIHKNIFSLLKFNYNLEATSFLLKCKRLNLINAFQYKSYSIASKMYYLKMYKSKGLSRKIIKKIFTI